MSSLPPPIHEDDNRGAGLFYWIVCMIAVCVTIILVLQKWKG